MRGETLHADIMVHQVQFCVTRGVLHVTKPVEHLVRVLRISKDKLSQYEYIIILQ